MCYLGSSTNFSISMTSSLKDFLASRRADSNCSKKSESERAIRMPCKILKTDELGWQEFKDHWLTQSITLFWAQLNVNLSRCWRVSADKGWHWDQLICQDWTKAWLDESSHLPPSSTNCFDHHRVSNLDSLCLQLLIRLVLSMVATYNWHASSWHDMLGCAEKRSKIKHMSWNTWLLFIFPINWGYSKETKPFNAHVSDGRWGRPNKDDSFLFTCLSKLCVFWQKTIARMDRLQIQNVSSK